MKQLSISYFEELDKYTDAFIALAKEEGIEPMARSKLRSTLSCYTLAEIERAYDACSRFGIEAIFKNIT